MVDECHVQRRNNNRKRNREQSDVDVGFVTLWESSVGGEKNLSLDDRYSVSVSSHWV